MAEGNWSVIRVEKISAEGAQKTERHNERKNESYANLNVDTEQIARNVHFKDTGGLTYNEYFQRLIDEGKISTRGQKAGATIFNELVIDVNTRYFEEHGGYEYARQFYEEAYRFGCEIYGEDNIVSAVMHADEINKAVSEELGKPVYHYHLHIVAIPTVRKEILWSKRCKDEALRGTVKEVINQVSHSKKWKNTVPLLDENGQQVISKYGKPMFRKSYSVLQDKLFAHMTEAGFTGFERGVLGSTAENLSSLDYQIQKDKERLAHIQERIEAEQVRYEPAHEVRKTMAEIEGMGQKTITGKIAVSKDDYQLVKRVGDRYKSVGKELRGHIDATYEKGHTELETTGEVSDDLCHKLLEESVLLAQQANTPQYRGFLEAFRISLEKHLRKAGEYRANIQKFAGQKKIQLAFIIEVETAFTQLFLNNGRKTFIDETGLLPMTSDVVNILSSIPSDQVDYIILYFTSAAFKPDTNAIAIRTGNIKNQLKNQNVTIYKYAGIDKCNDGGVSFTPPEVTHRSEDGEYQAKYSYSIPPLDKDRNQRIWPAFKTAYYAHKRGVPFVATREVQAALFTLGKFVDRFYGVGTDVGVVFQKNVSQEVEKRFRDFDRLYPLPKQNND